MSMVAISWLVHYILQRQFEVKKKKISFAFSQVNGISEDATPQVMMIILKRQDKSSQSITWITNQYSSIKKPLGGKTSLYISRNPKIHHLNNEETFSKMGTHKLENLPNYKRIKNIGMRSVINDKHEIQLLKFSMNKRKYRPSSHHEKHNHRSSSINLSK